MDDLISRQMAIDALMNSEPGSWNNDDYERGEIARFREDITIIKNVPSVRRKRKSSAQPEPSVIRCKNCKYFRQHSIEDIKRCGFKHDGMCVFWNSHSTNFEWYCSNGERSEDE